MRLAGLPALLLTGALVGCGESKPKPLDVELLSSDAHVLIADQRLVLPFIALRDYVSIPMSFSLNRRADAQRAREELREFRVKASNPGNPLTLGKLEVVVETYGWDDSHREAHEICPRLTRDWSRSVCENPWAALQQALPENRFYIVDLDRPEEFDHSWSVGGERHGDQLRAIKLVPDRAAIVCDKEIRGDSGTRFCTAAIQIKGRLGVVWTVWEGGPSKESAAEQASREGKAVAAFVRYAVGSKEDFRTLHRIACGLRRPGSVDAPGGSDCEPGPLFEGTN